MYTLFEKTQINGLSLKNRLVRSATWEGMCDKDGCPTRKLSEFYTQLATGGVGLIITGYTYVRPEGKQLPGKMGIYCDDFAAEMTDLVTSVHRAGGKICMQLVHAGGQADRKSAGVKPSAPSAVDCAQYPEVPRELTVDEIAGIVAAFGAAAGRAKSYGFDGVQLHGAHGYLINQFLSPLTNQRRDEYGGSFENRVRFLLEVYRVVRAEVGVDYPVMIKLNCTDFLEGGLTTDDALKVATLLDREGIDAIEVSGGTQASEKLSPVRMDITDPGQEGYHLEYAAAIKQAVGCPVMVVGGLRSLGVIEQALAAEKVDYISMARPLISEPDLPKRWQAGDREPARCISCNGCFKPGLTKGGIHCILDDKEQAG